MLEGFKKVNLTSGLPYVSITDNGITFSKNAVIKMGKPKNVVLLMNEEKKMIAVQICDANEEGSIQFFKNIKSINVRINNKDFIYTLSRLMNWNIKEEGYRILGDWYENEQVMIFDLTKAALLGEKENENDD
ncbi:MULTISPECIES: hypothetical protein [Clostridium]|uniref:hypothetical protein n=1 Tax=Clostridium TaxID=1485 RepID=UPI001054FB1F|nr:MULTISPECIES: hypothetical protein [Clostridium]MCI9303551.1 hypothetical protein [Clostridium sp.]